MPRAGFARASGPAGVFGLCIMATLAARPASAGPIQFATFTCAFAGCLPSNGGQTAAYGINDAGQIVGTYSPNGLIQSFLWTGTEFVQVAYPGARETAVQGINSLAVVYCESGFF
jgi:hypothetical protein